MENKVIFYHRLYLICLSGSFVFFLISVFLFIRLEIFTAIGFFTGSTERKGIRNLQKGTFEKSERNRKEQEELHKINDFDHSNITQKLGTNIKEVNGENTILLQKGNTSFVIEQEIMIVHTKEII